ncbi:MAG: replication protein [Candidatus Omnitrophica bacterium]|nr:replication protein [Candidatus Omnitrophota bacterium]
MANPQKENGHIGIANEIVEHFATLKLSGTDWQVLWVILRKTWGWHKKSDKISMGQIAEMTGLDRRHVCRALKRLTLRKVVAKNGDTLPTSYSFNKDYEKWHTETLPVAKFDDSKKEDKVSPKMVTPVAKNGDTFVAKNGDTSVAKNGAHNIYKDNKDTLTKDSKTLFPGESQKTKKEKIQKIQELTPIQKVVEYYRILIKSDEDEKVWNKKNFGRCSNTATKLLKLAKNDVELVKRGMRDVYNGLTGADLTCTIETIYRSKTGVRHFEKFLKRNPPKKKVENKSKEPKKPVKFAADMTDKQREKQLEETKKKFKEMGLNMAIFSKKKEGRRFCEGPIKIGEIIQCAN